MAADSLTVINRALVHIGEAPLPHLSGDDEVTSTVNSLYEPLILALLGKTHWSFAKVRAALVATTAPATRWTYAHTLPAINTTRVGSPISFFASAAVGQPPIKDYELRGATVESNHENLWIEYVSRVDESLWPESFARLAAHAFAAEIAGPITEQNSIVETFNVLAYGTPGENGRGGLLKEALQEDAWGQPDISLLDSSDPILEARWGGSARMR